MIKPFMISQATRPVAMTFRAQAEVQYCFPRELRDERRVLTVARVQDGALGLRNVALSLPAVVGAQGAAEVLEPQMSEDERDGLEHSADVLRRAAAEAGLS
jgi:malate/lactate dehydrogenase